MACLHLICRWRPLLVRKTSQGKRKEAHSPLNPKCLNLLLNGHSRHSSSSQRKIPTADLLPSCPQQHTGLGRKAPSATPSSAPQQDSKVNLPTHPTGGRGTGALDSPACVTRVAVHLLADRSPCWAGFPILHDYLFVTAGEWWHSA